MEVIGAVPGGFENAWEYVDGLFNQKNYEEIDIINLSDYFYEDLNEFTSLERSCLLDVKLIVEVKISSSFFRVALQSDYSGNSSLHFEAQQGTTIEKSFEIRKGVRKSTII